MKLDHVVLLVSDLNAGLRHYEAFLPLLGFQKTAGSTHVWRNEEGALIEVRAAQEPESKYRRLGVGMNHFGVRAESRAEVDRIVASMREAGFDVPAPRTIDEAYVVFVPDPDGIRIEVGYEPLNQ